MWTENKDCHVHLIKHVLLRLEDTLRAKLLDAAIYIYKYMAYVENPLGSCFFFKELYFIE